MGDTQQDEPAPVIKISVSLHPVERLADELSVSNADGSSARWVSQTKPERPQSAPECTQVHSSDSALRSIHPHDRRSPPLSSAQVRFGYHTLTIAVRPRPPMQPV